MDNSSRLQLTNSFTQQAEYTVLWEEECFFDLLQSIRAHGKHKKLQFIMLCTQASHLAKSASLTGEQVATIFGANKYVLMDDFDEKLLAA